MFAFLAALAWPPVAAAETATPPASGPGTPPPPAAPASTPAGEAAAAEVVIGGLRFEPFHDVRFLAARKSGSPILLYFEADWCVPCKEMHDRTFGAESVVKAASGFRLFRVDLTAESSYNDLVKKSFTVPGAPTVVMFSPGGKESARRFGFIPPEEFARMLDASRNPPAGS